MPHRCTGPNIVLNHVPMQCPIAKPHRCNLNGPILKNQRNIVCTLLLSCSEKVVFGSNTLYARQSPQTMGTFKIGSAIVMSHNKKLL